MDSDPEGQGAKAGEKAPSEARDADRRTVRVLIVTPIVAALTVAASALADAHAGPSRLAWMGIANATLMGGLAAIGAVAAAEGPKRALLMERAAPWAKAPAVALLVAGCLGLSHLLDALTRELAVHEGSQLGAIESTLRITEPPSLPLVLIGLSLAPGIGEELLFRGLLLRRATERIGLVAGTLLCAALFGAVHLDLVQGIGAGILGLYLSLVVITTGSVRIAIVCHVLNNALAIALAMLGGAGMQISASLLLGSSALAATLAGWLLARHLGRGRRRFAHAVRTQSET